MKYAAKLKDYIIRFSKKGLSTHEISFGVAVGIFVGFIPLIGTHTVLAIGLAYFLRLNTLIVLLGTQVCNPLSFPFMIFVSAEIGSLILNGSFLAVRFSRHIDYLHLYLWPIIVGSIVLGAVVSALSYFLVRGFLKRTQQVISHRKGR
jgi:uncharacterized protein (DUF2062 family)